MSKSYLEHYIEKRAELDEQIKANSLTLESLVVYQELNYRIDVLSSFKAFCKAAPLTTERAVMSYHYSLSRKLTEGIVREHQIGEKTDEVGKKKREAAQSALDRAISSGCRPFINYNPKKQEQYKSDYAAYINSILPLWIQYRNTYVNI